MSTAPILGRRMATAEEREAYQAFQRDANYLALHAEELKAQYPDEWVAVLGENVVAHSESIPEFTKQVRAVQRENETPVTHFFSSVTERWTRFPMADLPAAAPET